MISNDKTIILTYPFYYLFTLDGKWAFFAFIITHICLQIPVYLQAEDAKLIQLWRRPEHHQTQIPIGIKNCWKLKQKILIGRLSKTVKYTYLPSFWFRCNRQQNCKIIYLLTDSKLKSLIIALMRSLKKTKVLIIICFFRSTSTWCIILQKLFSEFKKLGFECQSRS